MKLVCCLALAFSTLVARPATLFDVNLQDREEVRTFFRTIYLASSNSAAGWNGNGTNCNAGDTTALFKEQVRMRINYFRTLAGLGGIQFSNEYNLKCQQAALMCSVNNQANHSPPVSFKCFTADGAAGCQNGNLAIGVLGPEAIDAYIIDYGVQNTPVGHRRWILYPQTQFMGTGDVFSNPSGTAANAVWVRDPNLFGPRPGTRDDFVAWPPPGYIASANMPIRWSFSYPGANFANATLSVSSNGVNLTLVRETIQNGFGENTLVWYQQGMFPVINLPWPTPTNDVTYQVQLGNVAVGGSPRAFNYSVKVFNADTPTPNRAEPVLTGPDTAQISQPAGFSVSQVPKATAYQLRSTRLTDAVGNGAENGLGAFTTNGTALYSMITSNGVKVGANAFRITHRGSPQQSITFNSIIVPRVNGELSFWSRLGRANTGETARVQISFDRGISWTDLFSQAGNGLGTAVETEYVRRTISLAPYAGKSGVIRFAYLNSGSAINSSEDDVGWRFDDITFVQTDEMGASETHDLPAGADFNYTPTQAGRYALEMRPQFFGQYFLDWGPIKYLTVLEAALPGITIVNDVVLRDSTIEFQFDLLNLAQGLDFQLLRGPTVDGPWGRVTEAVIELVNPTRLKISAPKPESTAIYRIKVE